MKSSTGLFVLVLAMLASTLAASAGERKGKPGEVDYLALAAGAQGAELLPKLLELAEIQAGEGSWELLAVARAWAIAGSPDRAQALIDRAVGPKAKGADWIRAGRVWMAVEDFARAKPWFDKVVAAYPEDEDWLAEIGSYYLRFGDAEEGKRLIARSFDQDPSNLHNTIRVALASIGKEP